MAQDRFDLSYAGEIAPGADPSEVRERLQAIFKLAPDGADRLFTGHPVIIKRDLDADAAARFEAVFAQAGAVLRISPARTASREAANPGTATTPTPGGPPTATTAEARDTRASTPLDFAPNDGFLEAQPVVNIAAFDTGGLGLVAGEGWTLADCEPPVTPAPLPGIAHLTLDPLEPRSERPEPSD